MKKLRSRKRHDLTRIAEHGSGRAGQEVWIGGRLYFIGWLKMMPEALGVHFKEEEVLKPCLWGLQGRMEAKC